MEPVNVNRSNHLESDSSLKKLPDFLLFEIFTYLTPAEVCTTRLICHRWKCIAEDRLIWKYLFKKQFPLAYPNMSPDLDYLEVYSSIQKKIKFSSSIRFNKFRIEEERRILHPRFKWPWVYGTNGRSLILSNLVTQKTHILLLHILFGKQYPILQPLGIKSGSIFVKTSPPMGHQGSTLFEVDILKGKVRQSYRPPQTVGRMLCFKKMNLYYVVHNIVHMWKLSNQMNSVLIEKERRIIAMHVKGDCIALTRDDQKIDLHNRQTGQLINSVPGNYKLISLCKTLNRGVLFFLLKEAEQMIESREVSTLKLVTTYPFGVVSQGFTQSILSEVVVDFDFIIVKVIHYQQHAARERKTTLEFFDIETGSSVTVIRLDKEPFGLFFKNGKIFYQVRDFISGKEKIKTEWVDFNDEKSLKRKGCVIS